MNTPHGLEIVDNCECCKIKRDESFCNLSPPVLRTLSTISHRTTYSSDATLFVEGQNPRGVFLLCSGKIKLSTSSRDRKALILKMAGPGEILGLSAVISGTEYELTAETAMPCQVNFVPREPRLELLQRHGEAGLRSAGTEPRIPVSLPLYPRLDSGGLFGREAGETTTFVDATFGEQHGRNSGAVGTDP